MDPDYQSTTPPQTDGVSSLQTSRAAFYSKVWFNTPWLAAVQLKQRFQKLGTIPRRCIAAHKSFF
jgi:hypothetical protein